MSMQSRSGSPGGDADESAAWAGMRPRFRQDALFAESEEGAYLQRPGDECTFKGRSAYQWLSTVVPRLTGEHTVEELTAGLSKPHHKTVMSLLAALVERGYVWSDSPDVAVHCGSKTREVFSDQIEYVRHFAATHEASFDAFREARFLLLGTADLVTSAGRMLLRNGAENVDIAPDSSVAMDRLNAEAGWLRADGVSCSVRQRCLSDGDVEFGDYDLVIAAGSDVRELSGINELAAWGAVRLLPLVVLGQRAIVGPLVDAGKNGTMPCWHCALLRQSSVRCAEESVQLWRAAALGGACTAERCPPQLARMLGTLLAFEAFRWCTGVFAAETDSAVLVQDLDTTESVRVPLLPHPLCPHCSLRDGKKQGVLYDDDRDGVSTEDGVNRDRLVGEGGIVTDYDDSELTQSPLRVGRVRLPSVDGSDEVHRAITAFDTDTLEGARERAVRVAAVCYAEQVAGRGGADIETADRADGEFVPQGHLDIHSGLSNSESDLLVRSRSLTEEHGVWLPAAAAFPASWRNCGSPFEVTSAGAACAQTVREAQRAGLLSALGFAGVLSALRGAAPAEVFEPDESSLTFLLGIVHQRGVPVRFLDLPGAAPAFGCVVLVGDEPIWALGAGYRRCDAVAGALRDALGLLFLRDSGEAVDLGNPVVVGLDVVFSGLSRGQSSRTKPESERSPTSHEAILEQLRQDKRDAFAVDTTPRDVREAGLVTTRILLGERVLGC